VQIDLALDVLSDIMGWDFERCRTEYAWLRLMAKFKYDEYRDFVAGMRFFESLADWLQQFPISEREDAYQFLKKHLLFFSATEMQHLVELFYPDVVRARILAQVAEHANIPPYMVWSRTESVTLYRQFLRKSLFFGLSDGARIDTFRRTTAGIVSNEQVMLATEISEAKWTQVLRKLREESEDKDARFRTIFLIDDFNATGTTLNGKLDRFWENLKQYGIQKSHMEPDWLLHVHHYTCTSDAATKAETTNAAIAASRPDDWFRNVRFSHSLKLSTHLKVTQSTAGGFWHAIQTYYDPSIETDHTRKGGFKDVKLGFGYCALPLILEHNTPNNSIPLLWAETEGENGAHAMRPLFRRRQRHTELSHG
jgi:hypothetical protein